MFRCFAALFVFTLLPARAIAGELYTEFPEKIRPGEKYVFYSHGFIVEGTNPRPENKRWGIYEFPAIKRALSAPGYNLIAYHRPAKTNPVTFAEKMAGDIRTLLREGVKAQDIYLMGFSRGGAISILTSNVLKLDKINLVILAGCSKYMKNNSQYRMYGKVYSIYETSDGVGSCQFVVDRSPRVQAFKEIAISTGKEHGAFYRPISQWLVPVKKWLNGAEA
ncbi:alpha/beta hydrolase [Thalassomonas actiniarum]|uniref:Alpha/beta hydrolase n=1 Tax=Thalassomonas actiniarum TaxID=485447 RepID=A0AAF0C1J6_9GAMM|nr:alpha/beta hydrolase [Thalassomonas actiniarum]WDD97507.1 alpha/beta hydrolase [Thalassomonas actiniarum]